MGVRLRARYAWAASIATAVAVLTPPLTMSASAAVVRLARGTWPVYNDPDASSALGPMHGVAWALIEVALPVGLLALLLLLATLVYMWRKLSLHLRAALALLPMAAH